MRRVTSISALVAAASMIAQFESRAFAGAQAACDARVDVHWIAAARVDDGDELDRWCRGVGPPLYVPTPATSTAEPPGLEDLVVVTWNAHLAEGRLDALVQQLRAGALTEGRRVAHFVLLAQELFRREEVPVFATSARAARAIRVGNEDAPDVRDYVRTLGVSMLYLPAVRNGLGAPEDRGSAIVSSEPLLQPFAYELPFERQRRVAVGAAIDVMHDGRRSTLRVLNAHLENLSAPRSLWVFRNPRTRQMDALLDLLSASRFEDDVAWVGTILGGDFNTVQGGEHESVYRRARRWGSSLVAEDRRATHMMGRLDYLLFRLAPALTAQTIRLDEKFGSDHHPVMGRVTKISE